MSLFAAFKAHLLEAGLDHTYLIALSGGLDSHVLLHLAYQLRKDFPVNIRAVHINHHLSVHADVWAAHCEKMAADYGIHCEVHHLSITQDAGISLEEEARNKRYHLFAQCLHSGEILLTAHHQDDQAETVLLQLLRGAGPKGLAAMPAIKPFASGMHMRPLLNFPKASIEQYAKTHALKWMNDESNSSTKYTRNFLRHDILPRLKARWPTVTATIARSAKHCAEVQLFADKTLKEKLEWAKGVAPHTLSIKKLQSLNTQEQRLFIRAWIEASGATLPSTAKLESIARTMLTAKEDRFPCVTWGKIILRRYRDMLYLLPLNPPFRMDDAILWDLSVSMTLPGVGVLDSSLLPGEGLHPSFQRVQVRFRQGGEWMVVPNRGRRYLKNLFQEWSIVPWLRNRIPLIYIEDRLASVLGYCIDPHFAVQNKEEKGRVLQMAWDSCLILGEEKNHKPRIARGSMID